MSFIETTPLPDVSHTHHILTHFHIHFLSEIQDLKKEKEYQGSILRRNGQEVKTVLLKLRV